MHYHVRNKLPIENKKSQLFHLCVHSKVNTVSVFVVCEMNKLATFEYIMKQISEVKENRSHLSRRPFQKEWGRAV